MSNLIAISHRSLLTPFNVVAGIIVLLGLIITFLRFTKGLGAVTNLSDYNPWGLWIGFDLLCGVALAAGGYVTSAAVYIFGLKKYHSAVRPAILTGFLGYALVVLALNYDVGRPWRLPYPFIVQQGTTSVLFEVGACVLLYLIVLFVEFTPSALEWLGLKESQESDPPPDHGPDLSGSDPVHLAPVVSWRPFPDRSFEASSSMVLPVHSRLLLRLKHHCGAFDGDL